MDKWCYVVGGKGLAGFSSVDNVLTSSRVVNTRAIDSGIITGFPQVVHIIWVSCPHCLHGAKVSDSGAGVGCNWAGFGQEADPLMEALSGAGIITSDLSGRREMSISSPARHFMSIRVATEILRQVELPWLNSLRLYN